MTKTMKLTIWILFLLSVMGMVSAQDSCAADIAMTFSRMVGACSDVERNQVCYGSGQIQTDNQMQASDALVKIGDIMNLDIIRQLSIESPDAENWSTAILKLQGNLSTNGQRYATAILFGSVTLTNHIDSILHISTTPRANINIRALPDDNAGIIEQVNVNAELIANGRDEDSRWLRIRLPNQDALGWVTSELLIPESDIDQLPIVTLDDIIEQPFEHFTLLSDGQLDCEGAPTSGLLLQSPGKDETYEVQINGITLQSTGTAYITVLSNDLMTVYAIEGEVNILNNGQFFPMGGGTRIQFVVDSDGQVTDIASDVSGYDPIILQTLPYRYLERRIQIAPSLSDDEIASLRDRIIPTSEPAESAEADTCVYTVTSNANIRNGATLDYAIIQTLSPNTRVYPRLQTTDANGNIWLQVGQELWIQDHNVEASEDCTPLPALPWEALTTSTLNTVSLEACDSSNGPIEAGQLVTFEFVPPAWENFFTAREATDTNRGRILVGDAVTLYPTVTEPFKISENEFVRRFSGQWVAELGTYRVEGNHYAYEIICTITVIPRS